MKNSFKAIIATVATTGLLLTAAPAAQATNTTAACVDGRVRTNMTVTWNSNSNVTVQTKDGRKLCDDITVYFSSYTMPANYNGGSFSNNPTATPQIVFNSAKTVMKKGSNEAVNLTITTPEACKSYQVDVYYGPEIKTVGPQGHRGQGLGGGKIIQKTVDSCETPTTPVVETPVVDVPVETPAELPTEVAATGPEAFAAVGTLLATGTYAATSFLANRRR